MDLGKSEFSYNFKVAEALLVRKESRSFSRLAVEKIDHRRGLKLWGHYIVKFYLLEVFGYLLKLSLALLSVLFGYLDSLSFLFLKFLP